MGLWRVHWVWDTAGIIQVSAIFLYWIYGTFVPMKLVLLPYYQMGILKLNALVVYMTFSVLTISSLFRCTFFHPGRLPNYVGDASQCDWTYCQPCNKMRPPRAHHCRRCQHCVTRMDHHCPWINNCVGDDNHFAFILLILYTIALATSAFMITLAKLNKLPPCPAEICLPDSIFVRHEKGILYFTMTIAMIGLLAMSVLSCGQHVGIAMDVTTLETIISKNPVDLILSRPVRPLLHRYDEMCGTSWRFLWLFPCRKRAPRKYYEMDSGHLV